MLFTFCRTLKNETAVSGSFADITANFESVEAPDAKTLIITTKVPEPLLATFMGTVGILSSSIVDHGKITFDPANNCGVTGAWPVVGDFNDGKRQLELGRTS